MLECISKQAYDVRESRLHFLGRATTKMWRRRVRRQKMQMQTRLRKLNQVFEIIQFKMNMQWLNPSWNLLDNWEYRAELERRWMHRDGSWWQLISKVGKRKQRKFKRRGNKERDLARRKCVCNEAGDCETSHSTQIEKRSRLTRWSCHF